MNPPFSITIEITEARQCHAAVSQLLRVFPSLTLTITENERITASARIAQTATDYHTRDYVAACIAAIAGPRCPCVECTLVRANARINAVQKAGRLAADSDAGPTRNEANIRAEATDAAWAKFKDTQSAAREAARRIEAEHAADEARREAERALYQDGPAACAEDNRAQAERDRGNHHTDETGPGSSCK